jgi:hypothetical protein
MRELACTAFCTLSFACFYAAVVSRRPPVLRRLPRAEWPFRLLGALVFGVALGACWEEGGSYAWLVASTAGSVVATFFVLLAPVLPRVTWAFASVSGPLGIWLWWGVAHGL